MTKLKYIIMHCINRNGWCVYKKDTDMTLEYIAGAFESKESAKSECHRLNEESNNE